MTSEPSYLTIEVMSTPEAHTIVLAGEADLQGAPRIEAALRDAFDGAPGLVVIDLSNLTFLDSSGLHALVTGHELCRARGRELRIVPGPANVQRIFELTGMNEVLPLCEAQFAHDPSRSHKAGGST